MNPKIDPYATKLHKRIDALLIAFIIVIILLLLHPTNSRGNDTGWTGNGGNGNWNNGSNWDNGAPDPFSGTSQLFFKGTNNFITNNDFTSFTQFQSIVFDSSAGAFTLNGNAIKLYNKVENDSGATQTINLASLIYVGGGGSGNQLNPTNGDLIVNSSIFLDNGSTLNINGNNNHILRLNGVIANGNNTGSVSINQSSTVIFNAANTYTGDTQVNAGELRFTASGSAANSTIRLGGTGANSPSASVSLGVGDGTGGINIGSTLVVRPSSSGTQGLRLLSNLNAASNTYSGGIFLDADLTMRSVTGGTLNITGTTDIKNRALTIDDNAGNVNTQGLVRISGALTSSLGAGGSLVKNGANTLILQGTSNNYTGTDSNTLNGNGTQLGGGVLGIYGDQSLGLAPAGAYNNIQFTGSATLQDTANNISLHANRNISVASGATATFDSNGNTFTINGQINGSGNIAKSGSGTVILTKNNLYTGTTTVNAGTLNLASTSGPAISGALSTSTVAINNGGTLLFGGNNQINQATFPPISLGSATGSGTAKIDAGGYSQGTGGTSVGNPGTDGLGALTLNSSSTIDLTGTSVLHFRNSSASAWQTAAILSIYSWNGTLTTGGGAEQILFGMSTGTGLTLIQLGQVRFINPTGLASGSYLAAWAGDGTGEIVPGLLQPIPEPSTWAAAALALGAVAWTQRRRFRKPSPITVNR